ncbi:predicted protein [Lichtheimia corymbifera JMRC:FSU:9682]|uniref:Uncharacterized protein n=1 Tax=Lichtheimia corymbifera JMRC:FSU:9682 TaxID=1263082 RepID=A0A068RV05_9FUNG|nr:predicted protein [Lichtheimia corymbifera JMRC:FSU:9682]
MTQRPYVLNPVVIICISFCALGISHFFLAAWLPFNSRRLHIINDRTYHNIIQLCICIVTGFILLQKPKMTRLDNNKVL